MRAFAWDDHPEDFLNDLEIHLEEYGIDTTIESDANKVPSRLEHEKWDLIITDVLDDTGPGPEKERLGGWIAGRAVEMNVPLYIVTGERDKKTLGPLPDVPIYSKRTPPGFVASDIHRDLKRRGVWVDYRKVFVIYGHDRDSNDASEHIKAQLLAWSLDVGEISGESMSGEIISELLQRMRDAAAVVAVCTPDDVVSMSADAEEYRQPRQNVLLEIGMAMGLNGGLRKLTFLQRWKDGESSLQARLPSDLGGVLTMRFKNNIKEVMPKLKQRLVRDLGVLVK